MDQEFEDKKSIEAELEELDKEDAVVRLKSVLTFVDANWNNKDLREFVMVQGKPLVQILNGTCAAFPPVR